MIIMIVTLLSYTFFCVVYGSCSLGFDPNHYVETKNAHKPFTKIFMPL